MEKKDIVFLATSIIAADNLKRFLAPKTNADQTGEVTRYFSEWYQVLSDQYDKCR